MINENDVCLSSTPFAVSHLLPRRREAIDSYCRPPAAQARILARQSWPITNASSQRKRRAAEAERQMQKHMNRTCPNCREKGISLARLLLWSARCNRCGAKVGISQIWNFIIFVPFFLAFIFLFLWSLDRFGVFGSFIVTVVYLFAEVARETFTPLEVRSLPGAEN